jgi:hypothetical protein
MDQYNKLMASKNGVFFDDVELNLKQMKCSNINKILVNEVSVSQDDITSYRNTTKNNFIDLLDSVEFSDSMTDTTGIGISYSQINDLYNWIFKTSNIHRRFVIFDWDNTITIYDGLITLTDDLMKELNIAYQDVAEFIVGGCKRLAELKKLFRNLIKNNINFYILTNNPIARFGSLEFSYFLGVASEICSDINTYNIFYSFPYETKMETLEYRVPHLIEIENPPSVVKENTVFSKKINNEPDTNTYNCDTILTDITL